LTEITRKDSAEEILEGLIEEDPVDLVEEILIEEILAEVMEEEDQTEENPLKCIKQYVMHANRNARFLLSLQQANLSIAVTVLRRIVDLREITLENTRKNLFR